MKPKRRRRGQSLVEFTIMLPVVLMLLSGLIEFGFLLNTYLDVIDAAREAARFAANDDPSVGAVPACDIIPPPDSFWSRAWTNSRGSLFTASDGRVDWAPTNSCDCSDVNGDIVISAFGIVDNLVQTRYPGSDSDGAASNCESPRGTSTYQSKFSTADVSGMLIGSSVENSGAVLVEIFYEYEMLLGLPWITVFVPDPIVLHAYTIMPNTYAEPES
jgi:hypothetical protein